MARIDRGLAGRLAALVFMAGGLSPAAVKLPTLLANHMVLQRGLPVHVWGKADPGEAVTVSFRGETKTAAANELGVFDLYLKPGEAGGPFEMRVKGTNEIVVRDILVGEVWVAAGQSNMEWPIRWAAEPEKELAAARHPRLRLFRAMHRVSEYALEDLYGQPWAECSPAVAADFSAAGYHFGRNLLEKLDVPVGLIQMAWGGTPIDGWTSYEALTADAALMPALAEWARLMKDHPAALLRYHQEAKRWEAGAARAKAAGQAFREPAPVKPAGPQGPWKPGAMFNAMIAPASRYPVRGAVWYQGESNTYFTRAPLYGRMLRTMIEDWRRAWGLGDFPFLYVQLAGYAADAEHDWPVVREGQRQALAVANTAMVPAVDLGEEGDIHPKNKREVGRRLALAARARVYGESLVWSGPLFRRITREGEALRVWFDQVGGGLAARGGALTGFEIAGEDGKWAPAAARIDGATVLVSSRDVAAPHQVRYGWANYPSVNLYNAEGLPAAPFRSE